jgi:hypothetical protein
MHHPRLLIGLLVLATVLVDLVVWSILFGVSWPDDLPPVFGFLYLGAWSMAHAQVSLAAIWVSYGGKWMPWTTLLLVVTILGWAPLFTGGIQSDLFTVPFFCLLQSAMIVGSLGLARIAGVKFVHVGDIASDGQDGVGQRRFQFSLAYLLSWLTAVAVALGLLSYQADFGKLASAFLNIQMSMVATCLADTAIALAALWMILGTRKTLLRLAVLCLAICADVFASRAELVWPTVVLALGQVLWLSASLAVVRVAGFRLVRQRAGAGS